MVENKSTIEQECFAIMPISDPKEYDQGHFRRVYEDIIIPACKIAGYKAIRADDIEETDIIHISILKKLIEAPMAICDLSTRNPNVLFELGLRQAFDKPVILIQESGTPKIFDISILRAYEYCRELTYHKVIEHQGAIARILQGTEKAYTIGTGTSSIVRLLSVEGPAKIVDVKDKDEKTEIMLQSVQSQIQGIYYEIMNLKNTAEDKYRYERFTIKDNSKYDQLEMFEDEFKKAYQMGDADTMKSIIDLLGTLPIKDKNSLANYRNLFNIYNKMLEEKRMLKNRNEKSKI